MYAWSIDVYSNIIRYECVLENTDKKWWSAQLWQLLTIEDTNEIENVLQFDGWHDECIQNDIHHTLYTLEWKAFQQNFEHTYRDLKCKDKDRNCYKQREII